MQPRRHWLAVLLALPALVAGGCGGGDSDGDRPQGGPANAQAPQAPALEVVRPGARSSTRSERVTVEGIVQDGATVEVDGRRAKIEGPANEESRSRWTAEVPLERGKNVIEVVATLEGVTTRKKLVVTRQAPASDDGSSDDRSGADGDGSADANSPGGNQGGSQGDQASGDGGNQGGSGGSQGGSGGSQGGSGGSQGGSGGSGGNQGGGPGIVGPDEGNQGGQGGSGGSQGGSQGGSGGGTGEDGAQGGPPAAPPPSP